MPEVYGRPKHIYSIWRKMQKKHLAFDELFDVRAVRIVAERLQDCYAAQRSCTRTSAICRMSSMTMSPTRNLTATSLFIPWCWAPAVKRLKFRSVPNRCTKTPSWVSPRTGNTKRHLGRAGHRSRRPHCWLRKLIAWQERDGRLRRMLDKCAPEVFDDQVYVFTPKKDVVDLPAGSAARLCLSHPQRCRAALTLHWCENRPGALCPFTYQLQMGDQIEIITQKQPNPSRDWLNPNLGYVTSRGRSKIRGSVNRINDKNILARRQITDDELEHRHPA